VTIASLVVRLSAETAEFHQEMENVARRVEQTGRRITRAGLEISKAISLPIIAVALGAFAAALEESHRHFGPLFVAFETLKGKVHDLFLAIGKELTPVFLDLIAGKDKLLDWLRGLVDSFSRLSPGVKKVVIDVLLFLAALGPTIVLIGGLIRAIGAIGTAFAALTSPIGLVVLAVMAFAAAGFYVITHWDEVQLRLLLVWVAIKEAFWDGVKFVLAAINLLTGGLLELIGVMPKLRAELDAVADRSIGKSAAAILRLQQEMANLHRTTGTLGTGVKAIADIFRTWDDATRSLNDRVAILGPAFDQAGARAQIYGQAMDGLLALHVPLDEKLNKTGVTLRQIAESYRIATQESHNFQTGVSALTPIYHTAAAAAAAYNEILRQFGGNEQRAADALVHITAILQAYHTAVQQTFEAVGTSIGNMLAGTVHGLQGLGQALEGVVGNLLQQAGKSAIAMGLVSIAYGVLGEAIKRFSKNPAAAIAAGVALIALGSALSAKASQSFASVGGGGGGGGGGASTAGPGNVGGGSPTQGSVYVALPGGRRIHDYNDPVEVAQFKEFLEQLASRRVIFVNAPV